MAFLAAAPEAEGLAAGAVSRVRRGASAAKGAKGGGKRPTSAKGRQVGSQAITEDMSSEEVEEELQKRKRDAAAPQPPAPKQQQQQPAPAPSGGSSFRLDMDPIHTGSGIVLGTLGWVLFMNFLQGGMPQVRRWGAAKFLNKTGA